MPILLDTTLISHSPEQTGHQISTIKWTFELFCALVGNFAHFFFFSFWAIFAPKTLTKRPSPSMQAIFFTKGELFEVMFLISFVLQGRIQDFFRKGCTRLLLYFNTNKQFFFAEYQLYQKTAGHLREGGCIPPAPSSQIRPCIEHPSVPLILFCQAIMLHFKVLQTLTSIFFSKMTVSIHVHVYPRRSALPQHLFVTKVFVKNNTELGLLIRVNSECKFFCKSNVSYYLQVEIGETS